MEAFVLVSWYSGRVEGYEVREGYVLPDHEFQSVDQCCSVEYFDSEAEAEQELERYRMPWEFFQA